MDFPHRCSLHHGPAESLRSRRGQMPSMGFPKGRAAPGEDGEGWQISWIHPKRNPGEKTLDRFVLGAIIIGVIVIECDRGMWWKDNKAG